MSQVTVTLPDGSSRTSRRHARARRRGGDLAAPRRSGARRRRRRPAGRSRVPARRPMPRVRIVTDRSPKRCTLYRHSTAHLLAAAVTSALPRRAVRHRSGHRRRLLLRLRRRPAVRARGPRGDRTEDDGAGRGRICVYERQMWPREEAQGVLRRTRRAAQGAADRREDAKASREVSCYTIKDRTRSSTSASARTCRRPAG